MEDGACSKDWNLCMTTRCHVPGLRREDDAFALDRATSHHVARVLRLQSGEAVELFDGKGYRASAVLTGAERRAVTVRVTARQDTPPPVPQLVLVQSVIRAAAMDNVIRKATELGVARIQPVLTARCVARPKDRPDRWDKIAVAAAEQCGADWVPVVDPVRRWREFLALMSGDSAPLMLCSLSAPAPLRDVLRRHQRVERVMVAVGPEGDFSPEEEQAAMKAGALPVSLGALTLRAETASIMVLSALRYEYGGI